jgi:RNA polymerase sigma-70 factor (ECF subfamily)
MKMAEASALAVSTTTPLVDGSHARLRLEQMFRAHHQLIWRTLRRFGMSPDAAADGTQQAFLIAAERLDDIRPQSERAFLFGTAIRLAKAQHRKSQRVQLEGDMDVRVDPQRAVRDPSGRQTAVDLLDRVLTRMDSELVTVFILFELEGMSTPEMAELLHIPVGTAASRLRRARAAFRAGAARLEKTFRTGTKS